MAQISERPLLTALFRNWGDFKPEDQSSYLFGQSGEERAIHPAEWEQSLPRVSFLRVIREDLSEIGVLLPTGDASYGLRSDDSLDSLFRSLPGGVVYIDITGLSHHVWAPLLKSAIRSGKYVRAVYVEPEDYTFSSTPMEGEIFDLSERIRGISPLPGFTSLIEMTSEEAVCFIPLLGFEGTRLAYTLAEVQPPLEKVIPIIGVPGFRPEYPFHTHLGNKVPLIKNHIWPNSRYAIANSPFSVFYLLQEIALAHPQDLIKIAPIGTKPHALGAIMFVLSTTRQIELVYDHPIRKPSRTFGLANVLVYEVSAMSLAAT